MHRGLDQAAGGRLTRCGLARLGAAPPLRTGEVVVRFGVEDDVRNTAVAPLGGKQRLQLAQRAVQVHVCQADADERAVPAPLVRVEARRWLGPATEIVCVEDGQCGASEL